MQPAHPPWPSSTASRTPVKTPLKTSLSRWAPGLPRPPVLQATIVLTREPSYSHGSHLSDSMAGLGSIDAMCAAVCAASAQVWGSVASS